MRLCSGPFIPSTQPCGLAAPPPALPTHQQGCASRPTAGRPDCGRPFQLPVPQSQEEGGSCSWLRLWSEGASPQPGLVPVWPRTGLRLALSLPIRAAQRLEGMVPPSAAVSGFHGGGCPGKALG